MVGKPQGVGEHRVGIIFRMLLGVLKTPGKTLVHQPATCKKYIKKWVFVKGTQIRDFMG